MFQVIEENEVEEESIIEVVDEASALRREDFAGASTTGVELSELVSLTTVNEAADQEHLA